MNAATWPRAGGRLLVSAGDRVTPAAALADSLGPGDLLVLNDAATLPASLSASVLATDAPLEVRLAGELDDGRWQAVLFGPGSWRHDTDRRPAPPALAVGARLTFDEPARRDAPASPAERSGRRPLTAQVERSGRRPLTARVEVVSARSPRLVTLRFDRGGDALFAAIYALGRPVQYSYLADDVPLAAFQTRFASRPWAVEPPSAGLPLRGDVLAALRARGVRLARLTHAAGLSATGDAALDAALPLPERYDLPAATVAAVAATRAAGGRVIAVGTSVVRALEGCRATHGALVAGLGWTDLRLGAGSRLRGVDGLLTGIHAPGTSHFDLLRAFLSPERLERVVAAAAAGRYLIHEFGDALLILPQPAGASSRPRATASSSAA